MSVVQMIMAGLRYPNSLSDYISSSGNWAKFYKGQMVTTSTNTVSAGNVTYGLDSQTSNSYYAVASTYNLLDIPFDYTNSTIFYMEYKVTSVLDPNGGGFSSANLKSPKYGVTSIYSINANANPSIVYQEAFPASYSTYYLDDQNVAISMYSNYAMQARSVAVANVPINPKDITSTLFYQNGYNIASASPSTLVMPGYWRKVDDSGATGFNYGVVSSVFAENQYIDQYGYIIDTNTPASFSVQAGDLVIATTMLAKHPLNVVAGGDIQQIFSWTRNRLVNGENAHGMSIWISKVSATYSVSRAIDQYPGARFLVFRYDPSGVAPALPAVTPVTPIPGDNVITDGWGAGSVSISAYLPMLSKLAGQAGAGDSLLLLNDERQGTKSGTVISNRISMQNLVTLVSASGIRLTCSDNTPLTLEDGSSINSTEALGVRLPVQDSNSFRWEEIVEVRDAGLGEVATIYCMDQCYAAGDEPDRWIWTHNAQQINIKK
jgi:hypothetical protein